MKMNPYSFMVIGRRLIGPELNLIRAGNPCLSLFPIHLNNFRMRLLIILAAGRCFMNVVVQCLASLEP